MGELKPFSRKRAEYFHKVIFVIRSFLSREGGSRLTVVSSSETAPPICGPTIGKRQSWRQLVLKIVLPYDSFWASSSYCGQEFGRIEVSLDGLCF